MKANILVVDDDSKIIKVIKDFLEMENYYGVPMVSRAYE